MMYNRATIIKYLKVSILSDLLIQFLDELQENSNVSIKLMELKKEVDVYLSNLSNAGYEIKELRNTNLIQEIQNKVDTIFRKNL